MVDAITVSEVVVSFSVVLDSTVVLESSVVAFKFFFSICTADDDG